MKLNLYVQGFGQTFHIEINSESSVRDLKNLILKRVNERLSDDGFFYEYSDFYLTPYSLNDDDAIIENTKIKDEATIHIVFRNSARQSLFKILTENQLNRFVKAIGSISKYLKTIERRRKDRILIAELIDEYQFPSDRFENKISRVCIDMLGVAIVLTSWLEHFRRDQKAYSAPFSDRKVPTEILQVFGKNLSIEETVQYTEEMANHIDQCLADIKDYQTHYLPAHKDRIVESRRKIDEERRLEQERQERQEQMIMDEVMARRLADNNV
jgi:hypothetical protein